MIRLLLGITAENVAIAGICQIYNNDRDTQGEPNETKLMPNSIHNVKILFLINTHLSMSQYFKNRQTKALRFAQRDHYTSGISHMFLLSKSWHVIISFIN